jgi:hypothetical protein
MRIKKKRLLIPACVVVLAVAMTSAYSYFDPDIELPPSVQLPLLKFGYRHLSGPPCNNELYGAHIAKPFGPNDSLNIVVFDGKEIQVFSRPGGDDHRHAAMDPMFHVRVNAPNDKEAARYLRELFAQIGFRGPVAQAVVFAHGGPARPKVGLSDMGTDLFELLSEHRPAEGYGVVSFVSCEVAQGDKGRRYIQQVANKYEFRVAASERKIQWDFLMKWFKFLEGVPNYEFKKSHWLVATPRQDEPRRWTDIMER